MAKKMNKTKVIMAGGIMSAATAGLSFAAKTYMKVELQGIKDSAAQIILMGSKQVSRSEFIASAIEAIRAYNTCAIFFLVVAAALFALYFVMKRRERNQKTACICSFNTL